MARAQTSFKLQADVLAVASAGGHLDQLMLLREIFAGRTVRYASTKPDQAAHYGVADCIPLRDANQSTPFRLVQSALQCRKLIAEVQPRVVITTGAAPGLLCLFFGKLAGAYTIWIDSIANADKLSLSGRIASRFADETLTQHRSVADAQGASISYCGSVI